MYNVSKILPELRNVVGFKDHYDNSIPPLPATLTASESGKYADRSANPYLDLETIKECLPNTYPLDKFLEDTRDRAIIEVLDDVQNIKNLQGKSLLNSLMLFDGVGFVGDAIINTGRLCGLMVKVKPSVGLAAIIDAISIQLDGNDNFNIYVYHSSQSAAIATINYTSSNNGVHWERTPIQLDAENDNLIGGYYYIAYYQNDLTARAIPYKKYSFKTGNCATCSGNASNSLFDAQQPHFEITPFYVGSAGLDLVNRTKFDESLMVFEDDKNNYGFNLKLSVVCDLTQFYIDNRLLIADAIIDKITIKVMEEQFNSKKINQTTQDVVIKLQINLMGDVNTKEKSFIQKYKDSLKMLNLNFSSINKSCIACLPEYQSQKVSYNFF